MTPAEQRKAVITAICVLVAAGHLWTGPEYSGPFRAFVTGYAMDLMIPFSSYFLLCAAETEWKFLRHWLTKALLVVVVLSSAEVAQAFGYAVFGSTYDPLDLLSYAVGASAAAYVDRWILPRWNSWRLT